MEPNVRSRRGWASPGVKIGIGLVLLGPTMLLIGWTAHRADTAYRQAPPCSPAATNTSDCRWTGPGTIVDAGLVSQAYRARNGFLPGHHTAYRAVPTASVVVSSPNDPGGTLPFTFASRDGVFARAEGRDKPYPVMVTIWHSNVMEVADSAGATLNAEISHDRNGQYWWFAVGAAAMALSIAHLTVAARRHRRASLAEAAMWEKRWAEEDARAEAVLSPRGRRRRRKHTSHPRSRK